MREGHHGEGEGTTVREGHHSEGEVPRCGMGLSVEVHGACKDTA